MIELLEAAATLKRLPRTGWLMAGVAQPESVADHAWATALLAMLLAGEINREPTMHDLAEPLDLGRVVQIAIVHDLAESRVTDLPRRAALLLGKAAKARAEAEAMRELALCAPHTDLTDLVALWYEYHDRSTPEGRLVGDADKLEMIHQALEYERAGNRNLSEFWQNHEWNYQVSEELYATLVQARDAESRRPQPTVAS